MEKLKMQSVDGVAKNIEVIGRLFPNAVTEVKRDGKVGQAIDFDILRQELSDTIVEGREERYQFTWPDKKKAMLAANAPISATLRPVREESVDFDATENLYIEGDNLEVLKLLQETYLGKVKMIYIDPPYNTGNDFVYEDDFAQDKAEYMANSGQYDEQGNRLEKNLDSNGRFHTDWLNMMYPRLKLAKMLLSDDGLIFISIDDNEADNLRKISDEVFGVSNFITRIIWEKRYTRSNNAKMFASMTESIFLYRKSNMVSDIKEPRTKKSDSIYSNPDNDPRGVWTSVSYVNPATKEQRPNLVYAILNPITGKKITHPTNAWKHSYTSYLSHVKENRLYWGKNGENAYPRYKKFLSEMDGGIVPSNLWYYKDVDTTDMATKETSETLNMTILDFFSGSATTAHAVMQLNAEDKGNRKFIMVQIPEPTDKKSEAYKAGYKTICEIGKERIRRAAKKIAEENPDASFDGGFRVFRLDSSNMQDVYYNPAKITQQSLAGMVDNIKEDRNAEDLLFQVMLDLGVELSSKIAVMEIGGKKVFDVADNYLLACFDSAVDSTVVTAMAQKKPYYAVFRDSSFVDDSTVTNFEQIFKTYSPNTETKVL
jgi:adenine-specific DNA-methyltransferase